MQKRQWKHEIIKKAFANEYSISIITKAIASQSKKVEEK